MRIEYLLHNRFAEIQCRTVPHYSSVTQGDNPIAEPAGGMNVMEAKNERHPVLKGESLYEF